jgi:hypothetical protein
MKLSAKINDAVFCLLTERWAKVIDAKGRLGSRVMRLGRCKVGFCRPFHLDFIRTLRPGVLLEHRRQKDRRRRLRDGVRSRLSTARRSVFPFMGLKSVDLPDRP